MALSGKMKQKNLKEHQKEIKKWKLYITDVSNINIIHKQEIKELKARNYELRQELSLKKRQVKKIIDELLRNEQSKALNILRGF